MTKLYTADEVYEQKLLPVKPRTLMQYAREDKIGHVRIGARKVRFRDEDIEAYIADNAAPTKTVAPKPKRNPRKSYA